MFSLQARLPDGSAFAHGLTPQTLPRPTATTDLVYPRQMESMRKTQDSAMGSHLSDASEGDRIPQQPPANTDLVHSNRHTDRPISRPQQETALPRMANSAPAQLDKMVDTLSHLASAMQLSATQFRETHYYAADIEAQLKNTTKELYLAQQQVTTLKQLVADLQQENSRLIIDKSKLENEVTALKSRVHESSK